MFCAPFTSLAGLHKIFSGGNIKLGAQNQFYENEGTFTGEISAKMLIPYCSYVIVGHSERRAVFKESNLDANRKIKKALENGLTPILCIGETYDERNSGKTNQVIEKMLAGGLEGINASDAEKIVIAYEPIWAISKGKNDIAKSLSATPETAQQAHAFVRNLLSKKFGNQVSEKMRIIYGGSMKPENVKELMAQKDIDGGLVGGASLNPESFAKVVKFNGK